MSTGTDGKVLVITGASTGIGAATARRAVAAGWRIGLAARAPDTLQALSRDLGGESKALPVACDVSDWDSQAALRDAVLAAYGRVDAVFANAGSTRGSPIFGGQDSPEAWREMILTNVYGVAVSARLFMPELERNRGHLLMTGSVVGHISPPANLYSATKWAVTGMAESMRKALVGTGVRTTLVSPGKVDTPFWTETPDAPLLDPDDVARAVMFALESPPSVDVSEVLVRPTGQPN
ncbi:MAG: SDR family oxidoreductase [Gammaproteobacteria bacterium]